MASTGRSEEDDAGRGGRADGGALFFFCFVLFFERENGVAGSDEDAGAPRLFFFGTAACGANLFHVLNK